MIEFFGKLGEHLGFPINASEHGLVIDHMNGWIHWLMLILFIGWGIFFIYTLYKFGLNNKNEKADYDSSWRSFHAKENWGVLKYKNIPAFQIFDHKVSVC